MALPAVAGRLREDYADFMQEVAYQIRSGPSQKRTHPPSALKSGEEEAEGLVAVPEGGDIPADRADRGCLTDRTLLTKL